MAEYISREAVLKAFRITAKNSNKDYQRGLQDAIDCLVPEVIADIPSADVQRVKQWVKLHDKHPDTEGLYLVCDQYGECEVVEYLPDIKSWFTHKIKGEIQYWMPLPEPPKESDTT